MSGLFFRSGLLEEPPWPPSCSLQPGLHVERILISMLYCVPRCSDSSPDSFAGGQAGGQPLELATSTGHQKSPLGYN